MAPERESRSEGLRDERSESHSKTRPNRPAERRIAERLHVAGVAHVVDGERRTERLPHFPTGADVQDCVSAVSDERRLKRREIAVHVLADEHAVEIEAQPAAGPCGIEEP